MNAFTVIVVVKYGLAILVLFAIGIVKEGKLKDEIFFKESMCFQKSLLFVLFMMVTL